MRKIQYIGLRIGTKFLERKASSTVTSEAMDEERVKVKLLDTRSSVSKLAGGDTYLHSLQNTKTLKNKTTTI